MDTTQLKRIADAMEEILRLVKADQAQSQAQREKDEEGNFISEEFLSEGGLSEFVTYLDGTREPLIPHPIYAEGEKSGVPVEIAFQYNGSYTENLHSYVNNINTIEGGTHVAGFRRALTRTLKAYGEKQGHFAKLKFEISGEDFREGLTGVYQLKFRSLSSRAKPKRFWARRELNPSFKRSYLRGFRPSFPRPNARTKPFPPCYRKRSSRK